MSPIEHIAERTYDQVVALVERERIVEARHVLDEHQDLIEHSEQLAKLARVLAPPVVRSIVVSKDDRDDQFASRKWYLANQDDPRWRGLLVAVRNGDVVTAASNREKLRELLLAKRGTLGGVSVFSL